MSRLKEFHELEDALKIKLARLESLKNETELITELEFEKKLTTLMKRYNKDIDDVMTMLKWQSHTSNTTIHEEKSTYTVRSKPLTKKRATER